jgi:hypothetical protein
VVFFYKNGLTERSFEAFLENICPNRYSFRACKKNNWTTRRTFGAFQKNNCSIWRLFKAFLENNWSNGRSIGAFFRKNNINSGEKIGLKSQKKKSCLKITFSDSPHPFVKFKIVLY